jgi:mannose-6-phosphate isomerase-like protein (cupin superfamily)
MANVQTRRNFLRTASIAAAALPLTETLLQAQAPASEAGQAATFQVFTGETIEGLMNELEVSHGSKDLVTGKVGVSMTISAENNKVAKEFEYHQHRDHVFQILEGMTRYELGGTPKNPRQIRPGEWLAPDSEGCKVITLKKGDMLVVPRMMPHKRITEESVTLLLINATTPA